MLFLGKDFVWKHCLGACLLCLNPEFWVNKISRQSRDLVLPTMKCTFCLSYSHLKEWFGALLLTFSKWVYLLNGEYTSCCQLIGKFVLTSWYEVYYSHPQKQCRLIHSKAIMPYNKPLHLMLLSNVSSICILGITVLS